MIQTDAQKESLPNHQQQHIGLNPEQKIQLAETAREIYRQQLDDMQDQLPSLRSVIEDKENIIDNLMLRFGLGIIAQDNNRKGCRLCSDGIPTDELQRKANALAKITMLENLDLRGAVEELRNEQFHLGNEIYELQDIINLQVLRINRLEKQQLEVEDNKIDENKNITEEKEEIEDYIVFSASELPRLTNLDQVTSTNSNVQRATELNTEQRLQLLERSSELYRQQMKYKQDHLSSMRSLIQDKENDIENLMLRVSLENSKMCSRNGRADAQALAVRTIQENIELREKVDDLLEDNFDRQDEVNRMERKIDYQVFRITNLVHFSQLSADVREFRKQHGSIVFWQMVSSKNENDVQRNLLDKENWEILVDAIYLNCAAADRYETFHELHSIAENVLLNDERYRTLYIDGGKMQQHILSRVGGYEFLRGLGFRQLTERKLQCDPVYDEVIATALQALDDKGIMAETI